MEIPKEYSERPFLRGESRKNYRNAEKYPNHVLGTYEPYVSEITEPEIYDFDRFKKEFKEFWNLDAEKNGWDFIEQEFNGKKVKSRIFVHPENAEKINQIISYLVGDNSTLNPKKGIWLCGWYGSGKTVFMMALVRFINIKMKSGINIIRYNDLYNKVRIEESIEPVNRTIKSHCFIDDMAYQERVSVKSYGNNDNVLENIITRLYALRCTYFATSNFTPYELLEKGLIKPGDYDRMNEMFNVIEWHGESLR